MGKVLDRIHSLGVVPVVKIEDAQLAGQLGKALLEGHLPCAEITFRTEAAEEAIHILSSEHPDILVGAGTVLSIRQASSALEAGAQFIVSPGFDAELVNWCLDRQVAVMPGVATPTEITMALNKGLRVLKFFPAEVLGGVKALKALGGPFVGVSFVPTGGVNASNVAEYLSLDMVHACGGSWVTKGSLISGGAFDEITRRARAAVEIATQYRSGGGS